MKELKKIWYMERKLNIMTIVLVFIFTVGAAYFSKMFNFPLWIDTENLTLIERFNYIWRFMPVGFDYNVISAEEIEIIQSAVGESRAYYNDFGYLFSMFILIYGMVKAYFAYDNKRWIIRYQMPITRKMYFISEMIGVLGFTLWIWIMRVMYHMFFMYQMSLWQIEGFIIDANSYLSIISACFVILPSMILEALAFYGAYLLVRAIAHNGIFTCVALAVGCLYFQSVANSIRFFVGETEYSLLSFVPVELGTVIYNNILENPYGIFSPIVAILIVAVILFGAYKFYLKMDESVNGLFQYRWAEVMFYIIISICVFRLAYGAEVFINQAKVVLSSIIAVGVVDLLAFLLIHKGNIEVNRTIKELK